MEFNMGRKIHVEENENGNEIPPFFVESQVGCFKIWKTEHFSSLYKSNLQNDCLSSLQKEHCY